jgi:ATP-dependent DNA ligase
VKRVLRALVREKDLKHPSGYDIAILGGKEFVNKDFSERKKILFSLLKNVTIK